MRSVAVVALSLSSITALACASDPPPPPAAPAGGTETPTAAPAATSDNEGKPADIARHSQINISDEIRRACGITDADAYFAFDKANVRDQDQRVLKQLADCFSTGPLKGREMRLVGHTDPRGSDSYNMGLGDSRAQNVKSFIANQGLAAEKISTTSRGEMDATGRDEAGYARDRRVDVLLGD
jgi:peptidoglycan-associated lipoprotein